jgi:hypothetical protein
MDDDIEEEIEKATSDYASDKVASDSIASFRGPPLHAAAR